MTRRFSAALFCSVALSPMLLAAANTARAQTAATSPAPPAKKVAHAHRAGAYVAPPSSPEDVTVTAHTVHSADGVTGLQPGGGLMKIQVAPKSVSTVSKDYIQKQAPATSPFMLVQLLPGAVVEEQDPWGLSGGALTLRGLDQTEMAFIWEGMPIADVGVYTTYPSEFADGENLEDLTLQQGSSNIDTPTDNGSGGLFTFHDRDPATTYGGLADYGYGTYKYNREFLRLDTGLIGNTGIRAFASISHQSDVAWRGSGYDHKLHMDWKAVKEWGQGNRIAIVGAYQDSQQADYTTPTLADWKEFGRSYNYDGTYTYNDLNYWKLNRNPYRNVELSAPSHFTLTDRLSVDFTPYLWHGYGNGTIALDAYEGENYLGGELVNVNVPNANADGYAPELYAFVDDQYRTGFNTEAKYKAGMNQFFVGWWFDYSNDHDYYTYSPVNADGSPYDVWGDENILRTTSGQAFLGRNDDTKTTIHSLYLGDEIKLLNDKLTIDAGFKDAIVNRNGTNYLPGPQYKSVLNDSEPLPAVSLRYQIDTRSQVFASVSTNFRSPVNTSLYDQYNYTDGQAFAGSSNLKDEFSISEELGYRYSGDVFLASASFFHYNFTNRQIVTAVAGTNDAVTNSINAGGQTSNGFNAELGLRPWHHFRPYIALQYLHATIDNDVYAAGDLLPTAGKTAVESPAFVGQAAIDWDNGMFFWNLNIRYITKQYSTFMNDEALPAFYEMGGDVGFRLHDIGPAKSPTIQLNLVNLTDNHFLSGISSVSTNANTVTGVYGTSISGASPAYFIGEGFAAFATFKVGF